MRQNEFKSKEQQRLLSCREGSEDYFVEKHCVGYRVPNVCLIKLMSGLVQAVPALYIQDL